MTTRLVVGNWKMNGLAARLGEIERIAAALRGVRSPRIVICPPSTLIHRCADLLQDSSIEVGAQDVHAEPPGARTGDLSAEMLADAGARWVILGHSERRDGHRETDALVSRKAQAARRAGLRPIVCVGETADDRAAGQHGEVVAAQVRQSCPDALATGEFAIAYEPVWAIGSGRTPTPQEIAEIHAVIGAVLRERFADGTQPAPILYGGSVTASNAAEILAAPGVGGLLIGGASLTADAFLPIVAAAA